MVKAATGGAKPVSEKDKKEIAKNIAGDAMLSIGALWLRYFELGGMGTALELEAYLCGALRPSPHEYDVLAHTLNDRFSQLRGDCVIPYSDDEEP